MERSKILEFEVNGIGFNSFENLYAKICLIFHALCFIRIENAVFDLQYSKLYSGTKRKPILVTYVHEQNKLNTIVSKISY